ncbi:MAG TPA: hypothetical protein VMH32_26305 [Burkholderiales bacterium]|nr:hypothetical protein [Burkholderiales bacterium]
MTTTKRTGAPGEPPATPQPDSTLDHHPPAPQRPRQKPLRPGAKGQGQLRAHKRVVARQRGPR